MKNFSRLFLVFSMLLSIASTGLYARSLQNGGMLPDEFVITNDTDKAMTILGQEYRPGEVAYIATKNVPGVWGPHGKKGMLPMRSNNLVYVIFYNTDAGNEPIIPNSYDSVKLNFSKILKTSRGHTEQEYQREYTYLE